MTPERIEALRKVAETSQRTPWQMSTILGRQLAECLDEIERLQAALQRIADAPTIYDDGSNPDELREWAAEALGQLGGEHATD